MASKSLQRVEFFGRGYNEYMQLFNLEEKDFVGMKILDVNAGPSSFTATMNKKRFNVIACDVLYNQSVQQLAERHDEAMKNIKSFIMNTENEHFLYNAEYWEDKTNALNCFLDDYGRKNGHYVHGELPVLPFPDQVFDLVLSSHFLFLYASRSDGGVLDTNTYNYDFHAKAVTELARVCRSKLVICPVSTMSQYWDEPTDELLSEAQAHCQSPAVHSKQSPVGDHPYLAAIIGLLNDLGFEVTKQKTNYQYYENVDLLIAERRPES